MFDTLIPPTDAQELVAQAYLMSKSEADESIIRHYETLMRDGQWVSATLSGAGDLVPITFINGRLLLGVNRLLACYQSGVPLLNTVLQVD